MIEKTMKQIRRRQEKERTKFQNNCPHKKSQWMDYMWAPGHFGLPVRTCNVCEKILERKEYKESGGIISEEVVKDSDGI